MVKKNNNQNPIKPKHSKTQDLVCAFIELYRNWFDYFCLPKLFMTGQKITFMLELEQAFQFAS